MGNRKTLQPKPFTSENQPKNPSSRKGVPNRSKVYKSLLAIKINANDVAGMKLSPFLAAQLGSGKLTLYQIVALGQIQSAIEGNTRAWQEIQDSIHGKIKEEQDLNITGEVNVGLQKFRESAQKQYDAKRDTDES